MVKNFDPTYVREVLARGADRPHEASYYLRHAFDWDSTREGYDYWKGVYRHTNLGNPLPDEARAKLVAMLLTEAGGD